ncbi:protein of unknown function DUF1624 [Ferroglobus placidus DSM 10642]|uniref:Heparan-alpha-glucosaminide N-acetyltransferase catalytic domain-containing protein n=1 Tax=Ferroglobus placidus (strain DSM 10642 / AEDII12DO) TaxID=589924 RepID=D3S022_FERPA|nr:heparan-alpha-glucosaminide N-acetyltransferase [Ferroglobus placidus]ADC66085.1 protein of unknown function DUF1624 [Ferroglobus placidus DSM 10642]
MSAQKLRYVEVDFFRGVALIMMLISNFVTDLQYFAGYNNFELFWRFFALLTASMFVFISGVSVWLSHFRWNYTKFFKRFVKLFGLGLMITVFTKLFLKEGTIYFGVLHFLGVASILVIPFLRFGEKNVLIAPVFFAGKFVVENIHSENLLLLPLGITPPYFFTFDYFPIFPWFGVFLLGVGAASIIYPGGERKFELSFPKAFLSVAFLGRHTLKIYLLHQPIFGIVLLLYLGNLPGVNLPW